MGIDPAVFESLRHKRECVMERRRMAFSREAQITSAAQTVVAIMQSRMVVTDDGVNMHSTEAERAAYDNAVHYLSRLFALTEPGSK